MMETVFDALHKLFNEAFSSLKREGFSERFASCLIVVTMFSSITSGIFASILMIWNFDVKIPLIYELCTNIVELAGQLLHVSLNSEINTIILVGAVLVILNLPIVFFVGFQKLKTRRLIKKYREEEQNLIKP
jgi:hypothetical protein